MKLDKAVLKGQLYYLHSTSHTLSYIFIQFILILPLFNQPFPVKTFIHSLLL